MQEKCYENFCKNTFFDKTKSFLYNQQLGVSFYQLEYKGFLWKIPSDIIKKYEKKIINIHPALLPKYGGKGMYGDNVHKTVINNKETESGITIHYVTENYDEGEVIFQAALAIEKNDDYESLAKKIHKLEYKYFPSVIESIIINL